ncbi:MAG: hypothetical protein AAB400_00740 [Patescibacteria group bacterium]
MDGQNYNRAGRRKLEKFIKQEYGNAPKPRSEHTPLSLDDLYRLANEAHNGRFNNIPFAKKARILLERTYCDESEYSSFAQKIYHTYLHGRKFEESWVALYYLSLIIVLIRRGMEERQVRDGTAQKREQVNFSPAYAIVSEFAKNAFVNYSLGSQKTYKEWMNQIDILPLRAMFEDLDRFMVNFQVRVQYAEQIKKYMLDKLQLTNEDAMELKQSTNELFQELKHSQRYTIKQSCYLDETGIAPISGWACIDPKQMRNAEALSIDELEVAIRSTSCLAEYIPFREGDGMQSVSASHFTDGPRVGTRYSFDAITSLECKVGHDGELYVFVYPIKLSLRDIYKKCGMEAQYEFIRLQFIARLFDLIVPREISEQTPSVENLSESVRQGKQADPSKKTLEIIRDIITPRTLILRDRARVERAYDDELNAQKRQFLGRVGHPMRLRKGYKPHPDAKKWAKEDGFLRELEPNETWCRPVDSPVAVVHRQKGGKK